jgi:flagellar motor protein MotB
VRARRPIRREQVGHVDDWLMTYADMITLLLCFFIVFFILQTSHKALTVKVPAPAAPAATAQIPPAAPLPVRAPSPSAEPQVAELAKPVAAMPAPAVANSVTAPPAPADKAAAAPLKKDVAAPTLAVIPPPELAAVPSPDAAAPAPAAASSPQGDRITTLEMGSAAFFDRGSAALSDEGQSILGGILPRLTAALSEGYRIKVEGHTDDAPIDTPQFPSNWELSSARAAAVVRFFIAHGIAAERLRAVGYGDTRPKLPNRDAQGNPIPANEAANRRVVVVLEKLDLAQR